MYRRSLFHRFCILVSIAPSIFINGDAGVLSDLSSIKLKSLQHSSQQKTDFTLFPDNMRMSSKLIATCPIANNHEIASTTAERYMKSARIQAPSSWAQYRVNSKMNRKEYLTASNHFMTSLPVHVSLLGLFFSFRPTVLTVSGAFHAAFLGFSVWGLMGQKAWFLCFLFFVLGSLATKVKLAEKEVLGIAENNFGARGPGSVWGSGATAFAIAIGYFLFPNNEYAFRIALTSSMASKLADTVATEIGKAYSRAAYLITTWEEVPRGTDGAVSFEGLVSGALGAAVLSSVAAGIDFISARHIGICVFSAVIATTFESFIGALWQHNKSFWFLTNDVVNVINTTLGALISIILLRLL